MGLLFLSAAFMPHTGAQDQSRSEHFLQNGGCTVEAQDSGLLDGVVVLIEGEGAGMPSMVPPAIASMTACL